MERFWVFLILFEVRLQVASRGGKQEIKKHQRHRAQLHAKDRVPGSLHPGGCKLMTVREGLSGQHLTKRQQCSAEQGHALWTISVCFVCVGIGGCATVHSWRPEDILKPLIFSFLPPPGLLGLSSACQAWQQVSLLAENSPHFCVVFAHG